jgi:hypothetical protein
MIYIQIDVSISQDLLVHVLLYLVQPDNFLRDYK